MSALHRSFIRALTLLLVAATLALGAAGTASADEPGVLGGTITTSDDQDFTGTLTAYTWSDDNEFIFWDQVSFNGAASEETYSFALVAPGDYYVEYVDETDTYANGYANGAVGPPGTPGDPGTVHVTSGGSATANVTLTALPPKQQVTGNVEGTDGAPLSNVTVEAIRNFGDHDSAGAGATDEGGQYVLDLRPGSYELLFSETSGTYSDTTTTIQVANGPLTVNPVVMLSTQSAVTFRGRIFGSDGQGLPHAKVWLVQLLGEPGHFHTAIWPDEPVQAGSQGFYTIDGVERDYYYTVAASGYMHRRGFVDGAVDATQAGAVLADADQAGVDVQLTDRTTGVRGRVTSPYGPVAGVEVQVYLWLPDETVPFFDVFDTAVTDEDGNYAIDELPAGDYALRFNAADAAAPVRTAWLENDADVAPSGPGADGVFHVVDGTAQDIAGDRALQAAQLATGVLETVAGAQLAGGTVTTYRRTGSSWVPYATTTSGADGSFAAPVPASSTVTFGFAKAGYQTRFLGGSALPTAPTGSNSRETGATGDLDLGEQALSAAKVSSTTAAKLAKAKIPVGKSTKVTISVKAAGVPSPTGKVKVYDGKKLLKTVTLAAAKRGVVVVALTKPKKGKHKISATYLGSDSVGGSTSKQVVLTVKKKS